MTEAEILAHLPHAFSDASLDIDIPLHHSLALDEIDGLDSISRVRVMMSVEDLFGIEITPRENGSLVTIGDLIALITRKGGAAAQ